MRMKKITLAVLFSIILGCCFSACNIQEDNNVVPQTGIHESTANIENVLQDNSDTVTEQIIISVGGQSFTAALADTKAAEEFAAFLPLTMNMSELNAMRSIIILTTRFLLTAKSPI